MSDRIAVMHAGKVEQLGTPEELYERPTSRFVADFIGSTNLLRGRIESDGRVRLPTGELVAVAHDGLATGSDVEISIRPEAIAFVPATAEGALPGTVEQASYLGTTISYQVHTAGGLVMTVLSPKAGLRIPAGSAVALTWSPSEALILGTGPHKATQDMEEETA
jgi:ABC-type Fe3+/spermidine/putrescine transport system ATPase subunit